MSDLDPTLGRRTATDRRPHARYTADFFTHAGKLAHLLDPVERMATLGLLGASIGLCRKHGTDGHIRPEAVLAATGLPVEYAKTLMADNAWHQADHGCLRCPQPRAGHVYVHDYLEHNPSAEQDRRLGEERRRYGAEGAAKRWAGHVPVVKEKRPPGRPRKHPLPDAREVHPAEARAAGSKRGRPKKEPRIFEQWVIEAAAALADGIARNDPNGVRPTVTTTWLNDFRLMHEIDKREPEKIMKSIEWSQSHRGTGDFSYATIIKSPKKLRKHFAAMHSRAIQEYQQRGRRSGATGGGQPPAAVSVTGMNQMLAAQRQARRGGMVKGGS